LSEILPVNCSLSVILAKLNLTKLKIEFLKSDFKYKNDDTDENFIVSLKLDFFTFSSQLVHLFQGELTTKYST